VTGAAFGVGVPLLFHGRKPLPVSIGASAAPQGPQFVLSGTW
jgi:hypothetical protein